MATNKSLQLLRNSQLFATLEAAKSALSATTAITQDGVAVLGRYGADWATAKTVLGVSHLDGSNNLYMTFFENADSIADQITEINNKLGTGVTTANTVTNQLEALSGAVAAMDYTGVTTGAGVVITNVTEEDGVVAATPANVGTLELTGYVKGSDSGAVAASDTINEAISKLENQIDAKDAEAEAAIQEAIEALVYDDSAVTGSYVSEVDQTDGVISVTRVALPTVAAISEAGKPITAVSESLGEISAL